MTDEQHQQPQIEQPPPPQPQPMTQNDVASAPGVVPVLALAYACPICSQRRTLPVQEAVARWLQGQSIGVRCDRCTTVIRLQRSKEPEKRIVSPHQPQQPNRHERRTAAAKGLVTPGR
jgi:hypothetical protein